MSEKTGKQSYSQNDEEEVILKYFKEVLGTLSNGTFADIGASNGTFCSNTRALFENGWNGVFVEGDPQACADLARLYHNEEDRAQIISAAIAGRREVQPFWALGGGTSTLDPTHRDKWAKGGDKFRKIYVRTITIEDVMSVFVPPWDFISLDVEGKTNWEVLQTMDLDALGCRCLCVEYEDKSDEMQVYCKAFGLRLIHRTGENLILGR